MKKIFLSSFIAVLSLLGSKSFADTPGCKDVTPAMVMNAPGGYLECSATPDSAGIIVYEIALCSQRPAPNSRESCSSVFQSDSGRSVQISVDGTVPLANEISIESGIYTHALIKISNVLTVQAGFEFQFDVTGSYSNSTGKYCWTASEVIDENIVCDSQLGNAVASREELAFLGLEGDGDVPADYTGNNIFNEPIFDYKDIRSSADVLFDAYVLNSDDNLARYFGVPTDFTTDAAKIMAAIPLPSPVSIGPDTSSIDVGFKAKDMVAVALSECGSGVCATSAFIGGIGFNATAK